MTDSGWLPLDPFVWIALVVQLVGYAALSALVPGSEFATVFAPLRVIPTLALVPVAVLGVPAVVVASAGGVVLTAVGVRPSVWVVVLAAYACSLAAVWSGRRLR